MSSEEQVITSLTPSCYHGHHQNETTLATHSFFCMLSPFQETLNPSYMEPEMETPQVES
jgi:hypothetical protein